MLELLFEVVVQFVFELVAQFFMEFGFRAVASLLRAKITRLVVGGTAGFGFGLWWGARLTGQEHDGVPRLYVVSIVAALVAGALALNRLLRDRDGPDPAAASADPIAILVAPWRWDASRLAALALLNVAVAAGIDVGFHPPGAG